MGIIELEGNPPISVILRRSARARRISLRMSGIDGRVTLTLPRFVSEREGLSFLREKEAWLRDHMDRRAAPVAVGVGAILPVEGVPRRIEAAPGRILVLGPERLGVPGPEGRVAARLKAHLKTLARDRLAAASDCYATALGKPYARITLRDTRSRWGSCSSTGSLSYSWRLILAPPEILDYVAAHEVAHLAHMNHSERFWRQVSDLYGDWRGPRRWLRENSAELHRYRFDD